MRRYVYLYLKLTNKIRVKRSTRCHFSEFLFFFSKGLQLWTWSNRRGKNNTLPSPRVRSREPYSRSRAQASGPNVFPVYDVSLWVGDRVLGALQAPNPSEVPASHRALFRRAPTPFGPSLGPGSLRTLEPGEGLGTTGRTGNKLGGRGDEAPTLRWSRGRVLSRLPVSRRSHEGGGRGPLLPRVDLGLRAARCPRHSGVGAG